MSRFYASIQGNRGEATRQGTKNSGIVGHIRGWSIGGLVRCFVNEDGKDEVTISLTSGSNGGRSGKIIGVFTEDDLK